MLQSLEIQRDDEEWHELAVVRDSLAYTAKDLDPKHKYRFRVRAVNIHGPSRPSDESSPVSMEHQCQQQQEGNKRKSINSISINLKDTFYT